MKVKKGSAVASLREPDRAAAKQREAVAAPWTRYAKENSPKGQREFALIGLAALIGLERAKVLIDGEGIRIGSFCRFCPWDSFTAKGVKP